MFYFKNVAVRDVNGGTNGGNTGSTGDIAIDGGDKTGFFSWRRSLIVNDVEVADAIGETKYGRFLAWVWIGCMWRGFGNWLVLAFSFLLRGLQSLSLTTTPSTSRLAISILTFGAGGGANDDNGNQVAGGWGFTIR